MPKVAVVILNWNGREFLRKFLPTVILHSGVAEVIIADNASTDSSIEFMQQNYPEIRIIQNLTNGGFAKGYNDALAQVDADYFVLLNSDIEVTQNWITPVIALMESDHMIAACQPKIRAYYDREMFEYAGAAGGFIDKYGYPFCRGRLFQTLEKDNGQYDDVAEIFWATGACMFVRADLYRTYGGLDQDFFAHMEEIDYCWRLKNEGYRIMYCPRSTVFHVGGGTLPKVSAVKTYLNMRNNIVLLYKNLPTKELLPAFFTRMFLDAIAAFKFLFDGGIQDFYAVIKAHVYFYRTYLRHRKKRKAIHHCQVSQIYRGNLVLEYFIKGRHFFNDLPKDRFNI